MTDTDAGGTADRLTRLLFPSTSALLVQEMQRGVVGTSSGLPALAEAGADIGLIDHVAAVVKAGFGQRRKMLRSSLAGVVDPEAFARAGIRPEARAEELTVEEWGRLAQ